MDGGRARRATLRWLGQRYTNRDDAAERPDCCGFCPWVARQAEAKRQPAPQRSRCPVLGGPSRHPLPAPAPSPHWRLTKQPHGSRALPSNRPDIFLAS